MDGICVAPSARGLGVGTALLGEIKKIAVDQGLGEIRLDVIDTNPGAQKLYLREGFKVTRWQNIGPLRHLFGFKKVATMTYELP